MAVEQMVLTKSFWVAEHSNINYLRNKVMEVIRNNSLYDFLAQLSYEQNKREYRDLNYEEVYLLSQNRTKDFNKMIDEKGGYVFLVGDGELSIYDIGLGEFV